jgi:hypothetical protein
MNNASTFALLGALTGLLVTYGLMVSGDPDQGPTAPRLSFDEREAIRVAGAGTWRAPPHALSASEPGGGVVATEIVTIPAAKFQALVQKGNPVPQNGGSITIDLQRGLARLGCYDGEINGAWTTSTRQALKTFLERVNATLPLNQPEPVHLALVQSHADKVCGTGCPPGQGLSRDGRCLPAAILPPGTRPDPRQLTSGSGSTWSTTTTVAPDLPSSLSEGQMALAGPRGEIDPSLPAAKPALPGSPPRPRKYEAARGDWRAELWKRQN